MGGSFLELSCVRIAVLPVGAAMPDNRFEELSSYLTAFRELPVSSLPRRAAVPRMIGNATYSSMPTALREALSDAPSPSILLRSRSAMKESDSPGREKLSDFTGGSARNLTRKIPGSFAVQLGDNSVSYRKTAKLPPISPTHTADLDMNSSQVDSSFRVRYDVVHRDHAGTLIMKPFSEWDDFHSSKIWGVFGIVDCTQVGIRDNAEARKQSIFDAYDDFNSALSNFKDASVRRLIIFTHPEAGHENGSLIRNDPKSSAKDDLSLPFSIGYVPERSNREETRLEVRAQIVHFSGLLLHAIDRDCWKRRESPATELFLSPIDEKYTADRQSKLSKRRAGRLDKLLGDSLLLMGSPSEALAKYNSAIEKARANSDRLWLAGAMEGWSAAHVLHHVGSGRSVSDPILSDRLISHYAEIYKLYQKKRVAEPEAAAALRLAEFLGRWTSRRRDALDAAEHAATVGEGLRVQKRAALWEALARFSDRMGCRRKAALYLYRLGLLNASQSIWSSAVTLMIASERQLCRDGRKPWANLNRKVLLTAAGHAEEAGDSSTAARLYADALVITPPLSTGTRIGDVDLVKALMKAQVPAYLSGAGKMIRLEDITALQISGLSIREKGEESSARAAEGNAKDGPFIYNPFEAKKRAKAAAVARRAVTWVCEEPAQVAVQLHSCIDAELVVDVISVLISSAKQQEDQLTHLDVIHTSETTEMNPQAIEDDRAHASHSKLVRQSLQASSQIAKTIQETFVLHSMKSRPATVRHITVIPKRTGALYVHGILVRLFNGALVLLGVEAKEDEATAPVNVIAQLPRISLSSHSIGGGAMEGVSSSSPLTVYDGERRRFRVDIQNTGTEVIGWMKSQVVSSHPQMLEIAQHDFDDDTILNNLEHQGSSKSFMVEILGKPGRPSVSESGERLLRSTSSLSIASVVVEYEGNESAGIIRESSAYVKVSCKPAIQIRRLDAFKGSMTLPEEENGLQETEYGIALEIRSLVTTPATVKVSSYGEKVPDVSDSSTAHGRHQWPQVMFTDGCLIESGASARLLTKLPRRAIRKLLENVESAGNDEDSELSCATAFCILWQLPALGREGYLELSTSDLTNAIMRAQANLACDSSVYSYLSCSRLRIMRATIDIKIESHSQDAPNSSSPSGGVCTTRVGKFWSAKILVFNTSNTDLPEHCLLDIQLVQNDERGVIMQGLSRAVLVGATEKVAVGPLTAQSGKFAHLIKIRTSSAGNFRLQACLYDGSQQSKEQSELEEDGCVSGEEDNMRLRPDSPSGNHGKAYVPPSSPLVKPESKSGSSTPPVHRGPTAVADIDVPVPSGKDACLESSRSTPQSSESHPLKRVGIMKKKRNEGNLSRVVHVILPTTVDSYPVSFEREPWKYVLASAEVSFCVASDGYT